MAGFEPTFKIFSPLGGLEPPTFRLTAERANQLRHRGFLVAINNVFFLSKVEISSASTNKQRLNRVKCIRACQNY